MSELELISEVINQGKSEFPVTLYHYTTARTLPLLLDGKDGLVCTHYALLNDTEEVLLGLRISVQFLAQAFNIPNGIVADLRKKCENFVCSGHVQVPWIMSFSAKFDSLYQWIGYTDDGGYSIGFDTQMLRGEILERQKSQILSLTSIDLLPCLYVGRDNATILSILKRLFTQDDAEIKQLQTGKRVTPETLTPIMLKILPLASLIKHWSFEQEKECRLILIPWVESATDCEVIGGKLRWPLGIRGGDLRKMISSIMVSPQGNKRSLLLTARMLTVKYKMNECKIEESESPYNGA